jgi:hypothetical protein
MAAYLITGEYDFSCTPQNTRDTAKRVPGAEPAMQQLIGK